MKDQGARPCWPNPLFPFGAPGLIRPESDPGGRQPRGRPPSAWHQCWACAMNNVGQMFKPLDREEGPGAGVGLVPPTVKYQPITPVPPDAPPADFHHYKLGEPVRLDRKSGQPVMMQVPALTLCISPQPDVLANLPGKPGFRGRGLLARFAYILPESRLGRRKPQGEPLPEQVSRAYAAALHKLLDLEPGPDSDLLEHCLRLEPSAHAAWCEFSDAIEAELVDGGRSMHRKTPAKLSNRPVWCVVRTACISSVARATEIMPWATAKASPGTGTRVSGPKPNIDAQAIIAQSKTPKGAPPLFHLPRAQGPNYLLESFKPPRPIHRVGCGPFVPSCGVIHRSGGI